MLLMPALFLKGLAFKYGLRPDMAPKMNEARALLEQAAAKGVGGAVIELPQFDVHEKLNNYGQTTRR